MIIGPAYCVMFGAGPPAPHQTAARERFKRTTLAYMGCRSLQGAAKVLGIKFVGSHTRAIYSRLVTGDASTLTTGEAQGAYEWGDWAALKPEFWIGGRRMAGTPERDMGFDSGYMRDWPYRYLAAMASIYGWEHLAATGLFLDADVDEWWHPLTRLAALAHAEGIKVYLNGGRFRNRRLGELMAFDGLFYEAVHVGAAWEAESRENAEALLEHVKVGSMWVGIQVRFASEPTADELQQWSNWFLRVRRSHPQSVTFVVQPEGGQPRELPCPAALDPQKFVHARPFTGKPQPAPPPTDSEMP